MLGWRKPKDLIGFHILEQFVPLSADQLSKFVKFEEFFWTMNKEYLVTNTLDPILAK